MNTFEKSESIKTSLRQGFRDGSSKMAKRKCYGYTVSAKGQLVINSDEAQDVRRIFERYLAGNSLEKIVSCLERKGIPSPTGKSKWNPGQQHLKLGEKDVKKALRIQGGGKALFLDTDPAAKVSIFAECQSSFTQNVQVERGHIFTGPGGILVKDDIQTPV